MKFVSKRLRPQPQESWWWSKEMQSAKSKREWCKKLPTIIIKKKKLLPTTVDGEAFESYKRTKKES